MSNRPSKRSATRTRVTSRERASADLRLLAPDLEPNEVDLILFAIDPDDTEIIPMPPTIPTVVRATLTQTLCERFESVDDLDLWLQASNEALAGDSPFERIIAGDGIAVLRALSASAPTVEAHDVGSAVAGHEPPLKVVR